MFQLKLFVGLLLVLVVLAFISSSTPIPGPESNGAGSAHQQGLTRKRRGVDSQKAPVGLRKRMSRRRRALYRKRQEGGPDGKSSGDGKVAVGVNLDLGLDNSGKGGDATSSCENSSNSSDSGN
ncbi:hypothetical protein H4219_006192 [Mycoemilia scoparia]|uniref:Uncharacterized protein n=1 Tax=Mycoemilia scoparia TaxID=417184 RepID=A0A9W7ZR12_9FUNG|nr:hypothetical protein H4219_006192 [Mycoemilia scoparia]